jgi:hypothetical protein
VHFAKIATMTNYDSGIFSGDKKMYFDLAAAATISKEFNLCQ